MAKIVKKSGSLGHQIKISSKEWIQSGLEHSYFYEDKKGNVKIKLSENEETIKLAFSNKDRKDFKEYQKLLKDPRIVKELKNKNIDVVTTSGGAKGLIDKTTGRQIMATPGLKMVSNINASLPPVSTRSRRTGGKGAKPFWTPKTKAEASKAWWKRSRLWSGIAAAVGGAATGYFGTNAIIDSFTNRSNAIKTFDPNRFYTGFAKFRDSTENIVGISAEIDVNLKEVLKTTAEIHQLVDQMGKYETAEQGTETIAPETYLPK